MLIKRDSSPEIMDDMSIQDERFDRALGELDVINKLLGGSRVTLEGIKQLANKTEPLMILDAGAGGSKLFHNSGRNFKFIALDKNKRAAVYLKKKGGDQIPVCADVLQLPFRKKSIDIIHASLFLHHFNETELFNILNSFKDIARRGIIINDLRRSVVAYLGIKLLTYLFSKSDMVKHDGPLSVKKGFTGAELKNMMDSLQISNFILKRKWAFRWLLIIFL